jgi:transcriptional regulator with XRE-family HTH domain
MPAKPLTPEQNECVRGHLRELVKKYGTQAKLAARLGVQQPTISSILSDKYGASYHVVERMAALLGVDEREILGKMPGKGPVLPKGAEAMRELAADLARQDGVHQEAIDSVLAEPLAPGAEARSILWWADRMRWRERALLAELRAVPREHGEGPVPHRRARG